MDNNLGTEKNNNTKLIIGILIAVVLILSGCIIATNIINYNKPSDDIVDKIEEDTRESEKETEDNNANSNDINTNIESNNNTSSVVTSTDWKKYEVLVNNNTIAIPTTYNELSKATGFTYKEDDLKSTLQDGYYTYLNMYKNNKLALYIEILNDTNKEKSYAECDITRISQTKYQVSQGADAVIFPGGLKAGDTITEEKIIELFGTPDKVSDYTSDNYISKTYQYFENSTWTTTNNFEIQVVNGVIDSLQLDNRR